MLEYKTARRYTTIRQQPDSQHSGNGLAHIQTPGARFADQSAAPYTAIAAARRSRRPALSGSHGRMQQPVLPAHDTRYYTMKKTNIVLTAASAALVALQPASSTFYFTQPMRAEATAYNAVSAQTDDTPLVAANGKMVTPLTAACPSSFTLGTAISIDGTLRVCHDRMHARYRTGMYFDVLVPTLENATQYGRRKVEIRVL